MVATTTEPRTRPRARLALLVFCAGALMIILDGTIVNVALPSIQRDLGFSQSSLAWVVNAYLIPFGGLLLLAGRIGDLAGRGRVFTAGLALFTLASLACGLADSQAVLIGARFAQGIGGAMASAVILGMIVTLFPQPGERAKAIGAYSFCQAAGGTIGLLAGGVLTDAIDWHWIFFVNVPVGIAVAAAAVKLLPREEATEPGGRRRNADALGALLVVAALTLGVFALLGAADHGWASARTLGVGGAAVVLLAAFVAREATARSPLVPLTAFRSRAISASNLVVAPTVAGLFGFQFMTPLYLQRVLGYSPLHVGLAVVPTTVAIALLSVGLSPRLITRFGAKATLLPGLASIAGALALFARMPVDGRYVLDVLPPMALIGIGGGLALPSLMTLAMADADATDSGLASGLLNTTIQVAGAIGLAVLASLAAGRTHARSAAGAGTSAALTSGYQLAFAVAAGLVLAALVAAAVLIRSGRETAAT